MRIDAIRARAEAATEGPWLAGQRGGTSIIPGEPDENWAEYFIHRANTLDVDIIAELGEDKDDMAFIAHAREDIPWLLERVRLADAVVTAARGYFTCLKTPCDSTCKNEHRKAVYHSLAAYDSSRDEKEG